MRQSQAAEHHNQGEALATQGKHAEAIAAFRQALSGRWIDPQIHYRLGLSLSATSQFKEAVAAYRTAVSQRPGFAEACGELGRALLATGERDAAIAALRQALQANPTLASAYYYLGNALQEAGHLDEAIASFRTAAILQPDSPDARYNLALALASKGELEQAVSAYSEAVKLRPLYAEAYNNLGNCLQLLGRLDEAAIAFRKAVLIRPKSPDIYSNLGNLLKDMGRLGDAISCYDRAAALQPDDALWHSHRLYALHFLPGVEPERLLEEHLKWDRLHGQTLKKLIRPYGNDPTPDRRLRIGYVSADLREHVVGRNVLPLLCEHDRERFEVFCYYNFGKEDEVTARFRSYADGWRRIAGVGDDDVAALIRADGIDILIDLSLHMGGNRLPVFARKPAPVQLTFAGYPSGTGLEAIDYRLTDPYLDPPHVSDGYYREQSIRLPDSFWCFDPTGAEPPAGPLSAIQSGRVTFGCLNNFCKVNEPVLKLWALVLHAVPDSALLLLVPRGSSRDRVLDTLRREGIEDSRVEFADRHPRHEYLALYNRIDLALDTFPYNGHTTTLEGLWMGVPVVTRVGRPAVSRAGLSQLSNLGLADLAAHSDADFVHIASSLARDLARLDGLRSTLRDRMRLSPLTDSRHFAKSIEQTYWAMWQDYCLTFGGGGPPDQASS